MADRQVRIAFDDGLAQIFIAVDVVAAGNVADDGKVSLFGKGPDLRFFVGDVAAVEEDTRTLA